VDSTKLSVVSSYLKSSLYPYKWGISIALFTNNCKSTNSP